MRISNRCGECLQELPPPAARRIRLQKDQDGSTVWVCPTCGADVGSWDFPIWSRPVGEASEVFQRKVDEFKAAKAAGQHQRS